MENTITKQIIEDFVGPSGIPRNMDYLKNNPVIQRPDGSYVIIENGLPFHVSNSREKDRLKNQDIKAYVEEFNIPVIYEQGPTREEIINALSENVQYRLDQFAKQKGYDGIISLISYINSSNSNYVNDAQKGIEARDQTWGKFYSVIQDLVETSLVWENIEKELPILIWD